MMKSKFKVGDYVWVQLNGPRTFARIVCRIEKIDPNDHFPYHVRLERNAILHNDTEGLVLFSKGSSMQHLTDSELAWYLVAN